MFDILIAMLFALLQILLLRAVFYMLKNGGKTFAVMVIIVKFICYFIAVTVLTKNFEAHFSHCVLGFIAGLPLGALLSYLVPLLLKKLIKSRRKRIY